MANRLSSGLFTLCSESEKPTLKDIVIEMIKNFAAIDFETANQKRSSACSVGIVIVRNGMVEHSVYREIRPRPNFYTQFTTNIHGMCEEDTANAPDFPSVWRDIEPLIEGLPLVAHNSSFDEGVLKAVFAIYQMEYPDYDFYCTCRTARRAFPHLDNHKLKTVAIYCGFDLRNHHHALADAQACAAIALRIL